MTIPAYCLLFAMLSISWLPLQKQNFPPEDCIPEFSSAKDFEHTEMASLYDMMSLQQKGLSKQAFEYAYKGYSRLVKKKMIRKQEYLTICDFSQSSNKKRLYVVDIDNNEVVINTYVAHGRNSGGEFATRFSNKPESLQSSLGFYVTENTYYGEHGLSLRVDGLEKGYNDNAQQRAIVVHGADYIGDKRVRKCNFQGRSYGCPAIPKKRKRAGHKHDKEWQLHFYIPSFKKLPARLEDIKRLIGHKSRMDDNKRPG